MANAKYPTAQEFIDAVLTVAADCGYGWVTTGRHHPEDIAANLGPIIAAYAAGYGHALRVNR